MQSETLTAAYNAFRGNMSAAGAYEAAFAAEMPFVPLLWRNGCLLYTSITLCIHRFQVTLPPLMVRSTRPKSCAPS